jgi:hypothetical protein
MSDARFEDGLDKPLRLIAFEVDDLQVISAMVQDAVLSAREMSWRPKQRRFAMLLNRFRWEATQPDFAERVQAVLSFEDVHSIRTQGFDRTDPDLILSLLNVTFEADTDGMGYCIVTLAGDGAIRLKVEVLEASLRDVTRPYIAPSGMMPNHD